MMKYIFFLVVCLSFSISAMAEICPKDKPLLGSDSTCYSCNEKNIISINGETESCHDICPNRREGTGFYLASETPCELETNISLSDSLATFIVFIIISFFFSIFICVLFHIIYYIPSKISKKEKINSKKTLVAFYILLFICIFPWIILIFL